MDTFGYYLKVELRKRGWKQADLARAANLDSAVISNLINGKRGPGEETLRAIAHAFKYPPESVFRAAGLLPPASGNDSFEEWIHLLRQLPERDRQELLEIARLKLERQERDARIHPRPVEET